MSTGSLSFLPLCGTALCMAVMLLILREIKKDGANLVTAGLAVLVLGAVLTRVDGVVEYIKTLSAGLGGGTYALTLLKALGIAYITEFTGEICRSCGENTVSGYVAAVGKAEILVLCFPLIKEITETALRYI